ncbi:FERM, ARHGEF and pleckstrin domain-containing protein 1-like isoform X2 [Frieseomelitta varia]|uniref:FERM, ARHGEF and pleckstrin domain-containing protein 1-like isoform X2 n=1 Tax=Frieseomelitta varia TaxID=561572 RepID=UPI001CB6A481|nr:FERM, ARHGEF and pleckstrin domain-containing protein 1-like isoform X2 [Frieseomelitta varia]XP_043513818.1 FERM, ARHGEF and pleckstrin domain-containing protein 1-like isoform X2 [Frieseomelitta varia]XP_043513819.1 FERM, ARHGEF and pleckstrin domain-containing protein 1-like isoform X2 [Frieseomelitta varia]XP_043513820.1 FERM, ARHGEF and pleckstrin domain-containing protein 1-like isoform X2 [Frieseomelitta varia]XP_043513821.1 FERM, ARHGEF and pleckstrin domain-containing protein 1-like
MNDIESISMKGSGGSKMPHSHSTPAGVDGGSRTPPTTPRKAGKMLAVRVQMLDDTITMFQVQAKALGRVLFDQVCKQLHLLEADYFGLEYQEPNGTKYWLDLEKPVCRQVGLSLIDPILRFCVKFYTPDPAQLEEEFTRYLFCLQIKRDLAQGLLQCNDNTAALMASYIVQAECGDYVIEDYPDHTYLSTYKFVPHQDQELERRIMENHKKHAGQSPAEADLNLLETARRCELYGMKMHPAKDHEGVPLNLAVAHMGIVVFQNFTKINTFSWAKIRKISFKRKRFLIKLHPEGYGYYKDTVEFFFEGRNECKNFWKKCVENHGFFRCSVVKRVVRQKTRVLSRGSSFRYSGKTQKQIVEFVRDNYVKRQTFQRSNSFRQTSGGRALQGLEGGGYRGATPSSSLMGSSSISAHPLLPLGDPALETPALSLSCGSMTLDSPTTVTSVSMGGTIHRREDTATSFRTLTSIDVHSPATPSQVPAPRQMLAVSQQRISSADTEVDRQEKSKKQENNNSVFANEKSSPEKRTNGTMDTSNASMANTPDLSPVKNIRNGEVEDTEVRKTKRWPTDKAYYIAKELLMTERTYKKDLDVINVWFREEVSREAELEGEAVVSLIELLADVHGPCLQEMEARLERWESNARHNIGDFLYNTLLNVLPLYDQYLENLIPVLEKMEYYTRTSRRFDQLCRDFEAQKHCYLPLTSFLLKPLQRLLHYNSIIDRLLDHYPKDHTDFEDCLAARDRLGETLLEGLSIINQAENLVQLCEMQRDINGFDNLVQDGRRFVRQGCLQKYSRKGFQQRMFFLFSDILLYTFRTQQPTQCFRVHGQLSLKGMKIRESDNKTGSDFAFVIDAQGNQSLTVAASNEKEKERWLEDLNMAIAQADADPKMPYLNLKSCSSADEMGEGLGLDADRASCGGAKASQRSNTTVHVCWHRNTSISYADQLRAFQNQLSGFLLRKFKNSNGWQKLWVVFTNFCLFFYKSHRDDFPLASLPLLGYTVTTPTEKDGINKDFVFKLQFKSHVYFFRAESDYTFGRWVEVIQSATQQSYLSNFNGKEGY